MSTGSEDTTSPANPADRWFVRVSEDMVYGPVSLRQLRAWAQEGRLSAQHQLSRDRRQWLRAAEIPELEPASQPDAAAVPAHAETGRAPAPRERSRPATPSAGTRTGNTRDVPRPADTPPAPVPRHRAAPPADTVSAPPEAPPPARRIDIQQNVDALSDISAATRKAVTLVQAQLQDTLAGVRDLRGLAETRLAPAADGQPGTPAPDEPGPDADVERAKLKREITSLKRKLAAREKRAGNAVDKLRTLRAEHQADRKALTAAERKAARYARALQKHAAARPAKPARESTVELQKTLRAAERKLKRLAERSAEEVRALKERIRILEDEADSATGLIESAQRELDRRDERLRAVETERDAVEAQGRKELGELRAAAETADGLREALKTEQAARTAAAVQAKIKVNELLERNRTLTERADALADELEGARRDRDDLLASRDRAASEAQAARGQMEQLRADAAARLRGLEEQVVRLQRQVATRDRAAQGMAERLETERREHAAALARAETARREAETRPGTAQPQAAPTPETAPADAWLLRLEDGSTFGPVSLNDLRTWADECRIGPDHAVCGDGTTWQPAREVAELGMEWMTTLADGTDFGPLNATALAQLAADGVLAPDAPLRNVKTGAAATARTLAAAAAAERREKGPGQPPPG